jgi:hypothetical protein
MEMEEEYDNMEAYAEQYMNQPEVTDEMTRALSLAWTLLSRTPCICCHQGSIIFEPVLPGSLAEGARAICTAAGGEGGAAGGGCGLRLERDALLYLANAVHTHR